jgi:glutamine phosphoribosylpyrophosphate amidotransferase
MCGIIGFQSNNVTKSDLKTLKRVLIESRIRGKHASGVAWCNHKGQILHHIDTIPIDELAEKLDLSKLVYNKSISMIAHARYSTSDIRYNQPIVGDKLAIAHNGVITQSNPDTWEDTYGYHCVTKNDSELLLRAIENDDNIVDTFSDSSIAMVCLRDDGVVDCFRNSIRPLWSGKIGSGVVYASTFDILNRAGVKEITKVESVFDTDSQNRSMFYEYQKS